MACGGVASGKDVCTLLDMGIDVAVTGKTAISTPNFPIKVLANKDYEVTVHPPYPLAHLEAVDVSPPFVDFLRSMRMVKE